MSKRSKLEKFAENLQFPNVFENFNFEDPRLYAAYNTPIDYRGHWKATYFRNEFPLTLELACGRGEYSLGLARLNEKHNYIGIDIKGARIWKGAATALSEELSQVAFVRTRIELIPKFFAKEEVDEIWITFPDPFPRPSKSNRRLVSAPYLNVYKQILKPGSLLHLKTDNTPLYEFGLATLSADDDFEIIRHSNDVYQQSSITPELEIRTYYEKIHLSEGRTIKYIQSRYRPQ